MSHHLVVVAAVFCLVWVSEATPRPRLLTSPPAATNRAAGNEPVQLFRECMAADAMLAQSVLYANANNHSAFVEATFDVWNTAYNATRTPVAVALPSTAEQVALLVRCANQAGLRMAVRGGGHSYEAMSLINGGLVIDLAKMQHLQLVEAPNNTQQDVGGADQTAAGATKRLLVGAGVRLGPIYALLYKHNLTMEGPTCPSVDVSGATLGAGTGHSTRRLGLLADQVVSAEVVTMSGDILNVSTASHPDLFWALRGAGANYAIVTSWEFAVVPAPSNITYASLSWEPTAANLAGVLEGFTAWQPWLLPEEVARVHVGMFSDKIMLEAWLWGTGGGVNTTQAQHAAVAVLDTFRAALPSLPQPKEQLLLTRSFERYMLSQSVTDCYDVPEWAWSWANISTNDATLVAEQAWRSKHTSGEWALKGGSAVFMGPVSPQVWTQFAPILMSRVTNTSRFTRAVLIGAGGRQPRQPTNATGYGFRHMTMQVEVGTQATSSADAAWVTQVLNTLVPASQGRRFWNHFECLDKQPGGISPGGLSPGCSTQQQGVDLAPSCNATREGQDATSVDAACIRGCVGVLFR